MEPITGFLHLKPGRDKPVRNRHPWVFSGALDRIEGQPEAGDVVNVMAADGNWLAYAYYNPHSQIRARILSWDLEPAIDEDWWSARIAQALELRSALALEADTSAYRLIHAEADQLPGLVVDRYGSYVVLQALTLGIDRRKAMLARLLDYFLRPEGIVERSDVDVREKEGLTADRGLLSGQHPPEEVVVHENGLRFGVNLLEGHKTGLYLDQRENRALVGQHRFVEGKEVLNVFAYTGGFALYAAAAGATSITNLDSSIPALEQAERNVLLNFPEREADEYIAGDAFQVLRHYRDTGRQFDVVILDPPKFAHGQGDVQSATRGYKDLNWLAFKLLRPGGYLATFSCSGLIHAELFQKVVFGAAVDAGRNAKILYQMTQAADHPVLLTFPESVYLKGLLLRVL